MNSGPGVSGNGWELGVVADFDLPLLEPGLFWLGSPNTPSPLVLDPIAGMGRAVPVTNPPSLRGGAAEDERGG